MALRVAARPPSIDGRRLARGTHRVVRICMRCSALLGVEYWPGPTAGTRETSGLCAPCCDALLARVGDAMPTARCA